MGLELWSKLILGGLRYFTANDNGKAALTQNGYGSVTILGLKLGPYLTLLLLPFTTTNSNVLEDHPQNWFRHIFFHLNAVTHKNQHWRPFKPEQVLLEKIAVT